jgi:hypothetical protein
MKKEGKLFVYEFGKDFDSRGGALTLDKREVTTGEEEGGYSSRTHDDGWTIEGEIREDYYVWVNEFKANHPKFGKVWGDFEDKVYAEKKSGYEDFYSKHKPADWDYGDI